MNQAKSGFKESILSIAVGGALSGAIQSTLSPAERILFLVISIIMAIFTVRDIVNANPGFVIGWLFGAWILKSMMNLLDSSIFWAILVIWLFLYLRNISNKAPIK